jgi:hypothetical protein
MANGVRLSRALAWAAIVAAAAAVCMLPARGPLFAQFAANTRVNNGLYGAGTVTTGSMRYSTYQTAALPSQVRQAYWQSGSMPSDVRMNRAAIGPMAPGGAISYVTPRTSYGPKPVEQGPLKQPLPSHKRTLPDVNPGGFASASSLPAAGSLTYSLPRSTPSATPNSALVAPHRLGGASPLQSSGHLPGGSSNGAGPSGAGQTGTAQGGSELPAGDATLGTPVFQPGDPQLESLLGSVKGLGDTPRGSIRYSGSSSETPRPAANPPADTQPAR